MQALHLLIILFWLFSSSAGKTAQSSSAWTIEAAPWPAADALFKKDPRWLGADDAYSVDLGSGRVLWLFADSFIATSAASVRRESKMIRNSLAIQQGYDPATATIKFYWRTNNSKPASFFAETGKTWHWPGHGIRLGDKLLIFLMRIRSVKTGLGFDSSGWSAVLIDNPDDEPSRWRMRWLPAPQNDFRVVIGSASVLRVDDFVYAFSSQETREHNIYLIRWPLAKAQQGNLHEPEWYAGSADGWVAQHKLKQSPPALFTGGQTEFTVHSEPRLNSFVQIQHEGFGGADLALRWATQLTGPWSPLQKFYRPAESDRKGTLVYASKAHPELVGADMVLTYVVNHSDFGQLVADSSIYYPRFLKGTFKRKEI